MMGPSIAPSQNPSPPPRGPFPSVYPAIIAGGNKPPFNFSPPLIAMVAIIAAAFLLITYSRPISRYLYLPFRRFYRRIRRNIRQRRLYSDSSSIGEFQSPHHQFRGSSFLWDGSLIDDEDSMYQTSPHGVDDAVIKTLPISLYLTEKQRSRDCAVCLFKFEDKDSLRTLPLCSHAFHVDCIDAWLRSHGNCPLCRAEILRRDYPFVPVMASRIRPSLDGILEAMNLEPAAGSFNCNIRSADHFQSTRNNALLKRSHSFGFERSFPSERIAASTTSPWQGRRSGGFWSKRASPFGSLMAKHRVNLSFKHYHNSNRGIKSPFLFRRRENNWCSEPRRHGSGFPSSSLRSGDLEALLSPERFERSRQYKQKGQGS